MRKVLRNNFPLRLVALILVIVLGLGLLLTSFLQERRVTDVDPVGASQPIARAASRGIEYLTANLDDFTAGWVFAIAQQLYRTVADEALAQQFLQIARQTDTRRKTVVLPMDFSGDEYLTWQAVGAPVKQLLRWRCEGRPEEEATRKLAAHIRDNGSSILGRLTLTRRIVAAFYLKELGIDCCNFYEDAILELRSSLDHPPPEGTTDEHSHLYALTHIAFTASGYFDHYLNRDQFEAEANALMQALSRYNNKDLSNLEIDLTAEMLIAQKLLRIPSQGNIENLRLRLARLQNPDGSWSSFPPRIGRVHTTLMCTLALIQFAPSFRDGGNIECVP